MRKNFTKISQTNILLIKLSTLVYFLETVFYIKVFLSYETLEFSVIMIS